MKRGVLSVLAFLFALSAAGCTPAPLPDATTTETTSSTTKATTMALTTIAPTTQTAPSSTESTSPAPAQTSEAQTKKTALPDGFSYITELSPSIRVDLRYAGTGNFTGTVVDGYLSDKAAILTTPAALALAEAQTYLESEGLGLLVYDAYRPKRAVAFFVAWAQNSDNGTKAQFFPQHEKGDLFSLGYIATRSGHSRGRSVDLTLVDLSSGEPLDMGGDFGFFGEKSWHSYSDISKEQAGNRAKLRSVLERSGFSAYSKEWWHYNLKNEPFPDTYFDFDVE